MLAHQPFRFLRLTRQDGVIDGMVHIVTPADAVEIERDDIAGRSLRHTLANAHHFAHQIRLGSGVNGAMEYLVHLRIGCALRFQIIGARQGPVAVGQGVVDRSPGN